MNTPVLFLVFNRPDVTQRVFNRIKLAKPNKLYIACDGPRKSKGKSEELLVSQVRDICNQVDWNCSIKTLFRDENLGCKLAVSGAIDWVFSLEERAIILEDDCLPDISFFEYCEHLLDFYEDSKQVMHIGGYKPLLIPSTEYDISFTRVTHVWGWATWRDRWKHYKLNLSYEELASIGTFINYEYFHSKKKTLKRIKVLKNLFSDKINTWDYQWNYSVRTNSGLAIRPNQNLVENIGHAHPEATHTFTRAKANPAIHIDVSSLALPPWIMINRKTELFAEKLL